MWRDIFFFNLEFNILSIYEKNIHGPIKKKNCLENFEIYEKLTRHILPRLKLYNFCITQFSFFVLHKLQVCKLRESPCIYMM